MKIFFINERVLSYNCEAYTICTSFLTFAGSGNVPAHGNTFDSLGDLLGLGTKPQNGVALSNVTPFTNWGLHAAKESATNPPSEFPAR